MGADSAARESKSGSLAASVVVPVFNGEGTLEKCLDALLAQDAPSDSFEIIVIDDGSVDATPEIARRYPVRYARQENQGPATARNHGAGLALAEILLFTDCDCVPAVNWIGEMLSSFGELDVAAVKGAYRTRQRELVARFCQIEFEQRFAMLEQLESIDLVDTYSAGYRTKVFREMGGFDTRFPKADNEDTELSYRMASKNLKMVFNPRAIVYHLGHPTGIWRYARLKFSRGYWRMVVYKRYPGKMARDSYTPQTLKVQILSLCCFMPALALGFFHARIGAYLAGASILVFAASSMPFLVAALRKDPVVGLLSPLLLVVRAAALGGGAMLGAASGRLKGMRLSGQGF